MQPDLVKGAEGGPITLPGASAQETQVVPLGQEDPLEEEMAIHFSILAWEIPWSSLAGLEVRPSSVAPDPAESRGAPPPPQDPSPLRGAKL